MNIIRCLYILIIFLLMGALTGCCREGRLKEENEILKQKLDALLTFIKDHKEEK